MTKKCYLCGNPATTKEHVPPLCLFPKDKDMSDGVNYRKKLITVPSCVKHNLLKSKDDEYLQLIIIFGYFNNEIGREHFNKKIVRALTRRPAILKALYDNKLPVTVDAVPTVTVDIDRERFNNVLEQICQGLHFNDVKEKWENPIIIHTPMLVSMNEPDSNKINEKVKNLIHAIINMLKNQKKCGENPKIFWYQMLIDNSKNRLLCRMCFYEGFDVFAISDPIFN
ncbi:hypothetical protein ACFL6H_05715 [Candidatus Latescibacterota bacterium]